MLFFVFLIHLISFQINDTLFVLVKGIEPYIHYSLEHDKLIFVQQDDHHNDILQLNSINKEGQIYNLGLINNDSNLNLHSYHISIGDSKALIKRESQMRPENNRLELIPLLKDQIGEKKDIQASYISDGLYHLINDSTMYVINRRDSLNMSQILHVEDEFQTVIKISSLFSFEDYPQWNNTIENHLLKYRMKAVSDRQGNTCSIFLYSSWLLCSTFDGVEMFAVNQPDEVNFPDIPPFMRGGSEFRSGPDAENHRVQSVDIAMDDNIIYILVFGQDIKRRALLSAVFSGQKVDLDEITTTTERVYLYDKFTGSFLREITLPNKSRAITVNENHLIVVESGERPGIRWIPKSEYGL
ncbi:hypothetical protein BH23THE1_BH23THE1_30700 [soil metagenome]